MVILRYIQCMEGEGDIYWKRNVISMTWLRLEPESPRYQCCRVATEDEPHLQTMVMDVIEMY